MFVASCRDYQFDTVVLLNLILFKAADSSRDIYEVAMQLLQVNKDTFFQSRGKKSDFYMTTYHNIQKDTHNHLNRSPPVE